VPAHSVRDYPAYAASIRVHLTATPD